MKIVIWCCDAPNQIALCQKVNKQFTVVGIVAERKKVKREFTVATFIKKVFDRIKFSSISHAWFGMLAYYKRNYSSYPEVPLLIVENINSKETIDFTSKFMPDVIMVSGTRMIREALLNVPAQKGIINLHTGLSPYVKGGPNCTNWCIANDKLHLIGNTIMWIDKGIDSGNIITTETVGFSGEETLLEVHIKVMNAAHSLYLKALDCLEKKPEACPNIVQNTIEREGELFKNNMWNSQAKKRLLNNFKKFRQNILSESYEKERTKIKLIKLE